MVANGNFLYVGSTMKVSDRRKTRVRRDEKYQAMIIAFEIDPSTTKPTQATKVALTTTAAAKTASEEIEPYRAREKGGRSLVFYNFFASPRARGSQAGRACGEANKTTGPLLRPERKNATKKAKKAKTHADRILKKKKNGCRGPPRPRPRPRPRPCGRPRTWAARRRARMADASRS